MLAPDLRIHLHVVADLRGYNAQTARMEAARGLATVAGDHYDVALDVTAVEGDLVGYVRTVLHELGHIVLGHTGHTGAGETSVALEDVPALFADTPELVALSGAYEEAADAWAVAQFGRLILTDDWLYEQSQQWLSTHPEVTG